MNELTKEIFDSIRNEILDYRVNIKLDYSCLAVEANTRHKFFASRNTPVTPLSLLYRHLILSSGINHLVSNSDSLPYGQTHYFEYKNPEFKYSCDHREESGLFYSYSKDKNGKLLFDLDTEVKVDADLDTIREWIDQFPMEYVQEEGFVFLCNLKSGEALQFKITSPAFRILKKIHYSPENHPARLRNYIHKHWREDLELYKSKCYGLPLIDLYTFTLSFVNKLSEKIFLELAKGNVVVRDFMNSNLQKYRYFDLLNIHDNNGFKIQIAESKITTLPKGNNKNLVAFLVFLVLNYIRKDFYSQPLDI